MQIEQILSREGGRKLGDPGFIRIHVEDSTYNERVTWVHPKGLGGTTEDLPEPEHQRVYAGLAKWYNTNYRPDIIGQNIGAYSLEELAEQIRKKQEETGVTDPDKYTYSFEGIKEETRPVTGQGKEGTRHTHALSQEEQHKLLALLRENGEKKSSSGSFENLGKNLDSIVLSARDKLQKWFGNK